VCVRGVADPITARRRERRDDRGPTFSCEGSAHHATAEPEPTTYGGRLDVRRHRLGERTGATKQCSEDAERAHARYYNLQAARNRVSSSVYVRRLVFASAGPVAFDVSGRVDRPPPLLLTIDGSPSMGKAEAPVVIVEFSIPMNVLRAARP